MAKPSIEDLREQVRAPVITADDPGYDEARGVQNGMFDRRPKVIVRAEQVADVMAAVTFAREGGLDLSIRGGGHSAPGFGTNDGGVVIDLSLMRHVQVDPGARVARASGGATWGDFNYATHAFGLSTTGGIVSATGIAGLTLGGGIGYLSRGYGLTCDNLISADVVLADGSFVRTSADDNPDLFWALRGGGGNFGVVTSFEYRLHPVSDVYVGIFFYEIDQTRNLLRFWRDFIKDAPREYGGFPAFQIAPPLPFVPEDRHGDTFCAAVVQWAGPLDEGENAMKPFRDLAPPVGQMAGPMPYPWLNGAFDEIFPKGMRMYWKGNFVTELTDEAIEAHAEHGPKVPEVSATMHLYSINGACHDVGPNDTAFAYRHATFAPVYVVGWTDPAKDAERIQWVRDYYEATAPHSEPGGYINFMDDDDQGRIRDNYRDNYDRLAKVKATYDPDNLFHMNQNIAPAK
jgi:FAD/FMN-containing dehydrogenase